MSHASAFFRLRRLPRFGSRRRAGCAPPSSPRESHLRGTAIAADSTPPWLRPCRGRPRKRATCGITRSARSTMSFARLTRKWEASHRRGRRPRRAPAKRASLRIPALSAHGAEMPAAAAALRKDLPRRATYPGVRAGSWFTCVVLLAQEPEQPPVAEEPDRGAGVDQQPEVLPNPRLADATIWCSSAATHCRPLAADPSSLRLRQLGHRQPSARVGSRYGLLYSSSSPSNGPRTAARPRGPRGCVKPFGRLRTAAPEDKRGDRKGAKHEHRALEHIGSRANGTA